MGPPRNNTIDIILIEGTRRSRPVKTTKVSIYITYFNTPHLCHTLIFFYITRVCTRNSDLPQSIKETRTIQTKTWISKLD